MMRVQINYSAMSLLLLASIACASTLLADTKIYTYTDEHGVVHYTNQQPEGQRFEEIKIKKVRVLEREYTPLPKRLQKWFDKFQADSREAQPELRNAKVVMYSAEWCVYCKKAARYFRAKDIKFQEYDIEKSSKTMAEFDQAGGRGLPLILIKTPKGTKKLQGFNQQAFEQAYSGEWE